VSPWKVILATMVIFGCGVVTGGLLMKTQLPAVTGTADLSTHTASATNQPPPFAQVQSLAFLRRLEKQVDLSDDQRDQIVRIMKSSQERSRPIWNKIAPEMHVEIRRVREEIREVLTPEQQHKMDELLRLRPRRADGGAAGRAARQNPFTHPSTNAP
jgi:Spy/CpxP family protein refolding chaperone